MPIGVFCLLELGGIHMKEVFEMGQAYEMNPYVVQATKIAKSLGQLTSIFDDKSISECNYSQKDIENIVDLIGRENEQMVMRYKQEELKQVVIGIIEDIESFGEGLSIENKRQLEKECYDFEKIRKIVGEEFAKVKQQKLKSASLHEERKACLTALEHYAGASKEVAKKLDKSIYEDSRVQKKVNKALKKMGVKVIKLTVLVSEQGGYEVLLSAKCKQGYCVTTEDVGKEISRVIGKVFSPDIHEPMVLGKKYCTFHYIEKPKFKLVYGVSQVQKAGSEKSGDNFLVMDIKEGKKAVIISDGMGSGESAHRMSSKILDAMEALLESGMAIKNIVTICNSMLISSQKGMDFGTLDICVIDTYSGKLEVTKAGGASTFVIKEEQVVNYEATSLPVGVVNGSEIDTFTNEIQDTTFVVMVTDGVMDLIKDEDENEVIASIIKEQRTENPTELSDIILQSILKRNRGVATDDMMVVVIGCWERKCG